MSMIPGLRQEQRLTPQLIQSMDILQLPLAALEARINQELVSNPVLEYAPPRPEEGAEASAQTSASATPATNGQASKEEAAGFERLERMAREYEFDPGDRPFGPSRASGERDAKMDAMANTASRPVSISEYLSSQWSFVDADPETTRAGELLIDHIEDDGYLRTDLAVIADSVHPAIEPAVLEAALALVQTLDPTGVGARDLRECLLLQLDALAGGNHSDNGYELERALVRNHLVDLEKNRLPIIAKATGATIEQIKAAVNSLRKLNPHPGSAVVDRGVPGIVPDVIVDYNEDGSGYEVRLARGNSPRLRISADYRKMMAERNGDKETRAWIRGKLEAAGALIDAIKYRRERLLELARVVVERQRDFLEQGPQGLKVLRMSELAEQFKCDPSTVSRTVAEKYIQMPRGIFPIRYFFTGGTESADGESTSWDSVKEMVRDIVDQEDKTMPLNDDQIVVRLQDQNIKLSRRTVAKYRQQLDIPSARQRKEF